MTLDVSHALISPLKALAANIAYYVMNKATKQMSVMKKKK
jgi:hypothetical protein